LNILTIPSLQHDLGWREKGPHDEPELGKKSPVHGQINQITAASDSSVGELNMHEKPLPESDCGRLQSFDIATITIQSGIMFYDGQAMVDESRQVEAPAFFRHEPPVEGLLEGLDGEEEIADEDQTVKGMANPQGMFAKIDNQVFRTEHQRTTVRHAGHNGVVP